MTKPPRLSILDAPHFKPDEELRKFLEEYTATNGRMYQDSRGSDTPAAHPSLAPMRPKYYGRKPTQRLAEVRSERLITQKELAKRAGTTRRTIIAIETGQREPSVYLALAIAEALDAKVGDIFQLPPLTPVPPSRH